MAVRCVDVTSWKRDRLGDLVVGPLQTLFLMLFFQVDRQSPDTGGRPMDLHTFWKPQKYSPCSPFLTSETPEDDLPKKEV